LSAVRAGHRPLPPLLAVMWCSVRNVDLAVGQQTPPYVCLCQRAPSPLPLLLQLRSDDDGVAVSK